MAKFININLLKAECEVAKHKKKPVKKFNTDSQALVHRPRWVLSKKDWSRARNMSNHSILCRYGEGWMQIWGRVIAAVAGKAQSPPRFFSSKSLIEQNTCTTDRKIIYSVKLKTLVETCCSWITAQ